MLHLAPHLRDELAHLTAQRYPREACGLLLGRADNGMVRVELVVESANLEAARPRDRFELDPASLLRADQEARGLGIEVVGVWHSHPDHPAWPSATDLAHAWHGWSYVILSITPQGLADVRSWRLHAGEFQEERLEP